MEIGTIAMGGNMAQSLLRAGHRRVAYDPRPGPVEGVAAQGTLGASSIGDLASKPSEPRYVGAQSNG